MEHEVDISSIDDSEDDDEIKAFRTPFQPHIPPSASTETFTGGEGMSSGTGMGEPSQSREEEDQTAYFESLPKEVQNVLNGDDEQNDFVYSPLPLKVPLDQTAFPKDDPTKLLKEKLASRKYAKEAKKESKEEVAPNVTTRPQKFDIPVSTNRRQSFEDQSPSSGTSLFLDDKATSIPVRPTLSVGFADMLNEKRVEKEGGRNAVESQNDLLQSVSKSSSKASKPIHSDNNPKTPSQEGRPMKAPHNFPLPMPFDLSVVDFAHTSPPRNAKPQKKGTPSDPATHYSSKTGRPVIEPIVDPVTTTGKGGRPLGSKNKQPKPGSISSFEFG